MAKLIVPARFILLILHLFLTIIVLISRSPNIDVCLIGKYTAEAYSIRSTQLIIGVSVSFFLFALEFVGFLMAFSIVVHWQNIISIMTHAAGVVVLCFYIFDTWCSDIYWFVFGFCCVIPGLTELAVWIHQFLRQKNL